MTRLESSEPLKVARAVIRRLFSMPGGRKSLINWRGAWWHYHGNDQEGRWSMISEDLIHQKLWHFLEDATYEEVARGGGLTTERYCPTPTRIREVAEALRMLTLLDTKEPAPFWIPAQGSNVDAQMEGGRSDPGTLVAFRNCIVDIGQSIRHPEGTTWRTITKSPAFFSVSTLDFPWDPSASCPLWESSVQQWSGGDENWVELLRRWMGYVLMGHRRYAKMMLMQGVVRGGKGTIGDTIWALLGSPAYTGISLEDITESFGMDGLEHAMVLDVREVSKTGSIVSGRASQVLKRALGGDPVTVNAKHLRQTRNVKLGFAPMIQCNQLPELPNEGRGLTSKMLILPFNQSFEGRENWTLKEDLKRELPGIARWALEGAVALERESNHRRKWPVPQEANEVLDRYHLLNNPIDQFLRSRFVENANSFVPTSYLWSQWLSWKQRNPCRFTASESHFRNTLVENTSWSLRKAREPGTGRRGIKGLGYRREHNDDL